MLISLMMNLSMFDPPTPPTPSDTASGGGGNAIGLSPLAFQEEEKRKRLLKQDDEFIEILKMWTNLL